MGVGRDLFLATSLVLLVLAVARLFLVIRYSRRYHRALHELAMRASSYRPSVSVIVPAYNEEVGIPHCLDGMAAQDYAGGLEVVVVDDGSSDDTVAVARSRADRRTRVLSKPNGGKASALNHGIAHSSGEIVVCVDADSILAPDAITHLVRLFRDPRVGAVGGMVEVAQPRGVLARQMSMEYISGLCMQRAAFAEVGSMTVMSGAISALRRNVLERIGGYSHDTLVEDFDATIATHSTGARVMFSPHAIAHTEAPLSWRDLARQRHRWVYGGFQVLAKYRGALFTRQLGNLSRIGLPYTLIGPWIDVLVTTMLLIALAMVAAGGSAGGLLAIGTVMLFLNSIPNVLSIRLAGGRRSLLIDGFFAPLFYSHLLAFFTLRAGVAYLRAKEVRWVSLERAGLNQLG